MLFGDKNRLVYKWNKTVIESQLEANLERFQNSMPVNGENTAMALGKEVGTFMNEISFIYKGIFVFYEVSDHALTTLIDDQYSPAAHLDVPHVNGNSAYKIYVYPEVWNNFMSYVSLYNDNDLGYDNAGNKGPKANITLFCASFIIFQTVLLYM